MCSLIKPGSLNRHTNNANKIKRCISYLVSFAWTAVFISVCMSQRNTLIQDVLIFVWKILRWVRLCLLCCKLLSWAGMCWTGAQVVYCERLSHLRIYNLYPGHPLLVPVSNIAALAETLTFSTHGKLLNIFTSNETVAWERNARL